MAAHVSSFPEQASFYTSYPCFFLSAIKYAEALVMYSDGRNER